MSNTSNALPESARYKLSTETKVSDEIGAVVCPNCNHNFVKLVQTGVHSNNPINWVQEGLQALSSALTGYLMFDVTSVLIVPSASFDTIGATIQTSILLITIFLLWVSLPVMQYMRIYSLWLHFVYLLNGVFIPIDLVLIMLGWFGGAS